MYILYSWLKRAIVGEQKVSYHKQNTVSVSNQGINLGLEIQILTHQGIALSRHYWVIKILLNDIKIVFVFVFY